MLVFALCGNDSSSEREGWLAEGREHAGGVSQTSHLDPGGRRGDHVRGIHIAKYKTEVRGRRRGFNVEQGDVDRGGGMQLQ